MTGNEVAENRILLYFHNDSGLKKLKIVFMGIFVLHLLLWMLLDSLWAHDSVDDNCTTITIERGKKYHKTPGDSVILECPMKYCLKKPEMKWYMFNKMEQKFHILNSEKRHLISWMTKHNFILNFSSVNKNDNGLYRCEAIVGKNKLESHVIELIVQDHSNSTLFVNARNITEDQELPEKSMMLIVIYSLSSLSALGLIFGLFGLWRHQVKNNISPEDNINRFNCCKSTRCNNDSVIPVSEEVSMFHQESIPCLLQVPNVNKDNCWTATKTTPNSIDDEPTIRIHHCLPMDQDQIIYATLSHEEIFQRSKSSEETKLTEYAFIRFKH